MAIGANVQQVTQLGPETAPGTQAAITRKLRSATVDFGPQVTFKELDPQGMKFGTAHVPTQQWSQAKVTGMLVFNEVQYFLASIMRQTTPQPYVMPNWAAGISYSPGAYVRPPAPNGNIYVASIAAANITSSLSAPIAPAFPTATGASVVDNGGATGAPARSAAVTAGQSFLSGAGATTFYYVVTTAGTTGAAQPTYPTTQGATVTDGTAVLTCYAAITWTQTGSDNSGAYSWAFDVSTEGQDILQTYTFQQGNVGQSRGRYITYGVMKNFQLQEKRTGECAISGEFIGGKFPQQPSAMAAGAVTQDPVVANPQQVNVYLDTTAAALGNTKIGGNIDCTINFQDRVAPAWVNDRAQTSWLSHLLRKPKLEVDLTIADDSPIDPIVANAQIGQRMFVRFEALGPAISPGVNYLFQWDVACQISAAYSFGNEQEMRIVKFKMGAEHDSAWGYATKARVINANSAL